MKRFQLLLALVAIGFFIQVAGAGTIHVPGDSSTIQAGINGAMSGDTVLVAPGTYYETLRLKDSVRVEGAGIDLSVIDASADTSPILYVVWGEDGAELLGFTIVGGDSVERGIFSWIQPMLIRRNKITGCECAVSVACSAVITENIIINNRSYGLFCGRSLFGPDLGPLISNNLILNSSGAIISVSSNLFAVNNTINNNERGVWVQQLPEDTTAVTVTVKNNIISNNDWYGVYLSNFPDFAVDTSLMTIDYNDVWNNFRNYSDNWLPDSTDISEDPLFVQPLSSLSRVEHLSQAEIADMVKRNDELNTYYTSLAEGEQPGPRPPIQQRLTGSVSDVAYDYHLQEDSPCIDRGDPDPAYNDPDGTRNDMGAYYFDQNPECQIVPSTLDFDTVCVGEYSDKTFIITNTGEWTLSGDLSESCADFSIVGFSSYSLSAGQSDTFTVRFHPESPEPGECTIETGSDLCSDVSCSGTGADFTIDVYPDTLRMPRGTDSSYTVALTSMSGFDRPCTLTLSGLPQGAVETFDPPTLVPTDDAELQIFVPDTADTGFYTLNITATAMVGEKAVQHSENVTLIVTLGTWAFYVEAYPDTQRVVVGDSTMYQVVMFANTGFTAPCNLSIGGGLPTGASCSFDPDVIWPSDTSVSTIFASDSTPAGIYEYIIEATASPEQETTGTAVLFVQDFGISASPGSLNVTQGKVAGYVVELNSLLGFDEPCTLSVAGLPDPPDSGVFDQAIVIPTGCATLNVYTTTETDTGRYTLTITAKRMLGAKPDALERDVEVFLRVAEAVDVEDGADSPNAPRRFALFQNQPNPFNPETQIQYYLPRTCVVRLTVYNILGYTVRVLIDESQGAGCKVAWWNGKDEKGADVSTGIYFYRIKAGDFTETKKMILLK